MLNSYNTNNTNSSDLRLCSVNDSGHPNRRTESLRYIKDSNNFRVYQPHCITNAIYNASKAQEHDLNNSRVYQSSCTSNAISNALKAQEHNLIVNKQVKLLVTYMNRNGVNQGIIDKCLHGAKNEVERMGFEWIVDLN